MINPKIFKAVLTAATKEGKDLVLKELMQHISRNYDYNDARAGHIIEMLIDAKEAITPDKVNLDYIKRNLKLVIYSHEKYNIKNITVDCIDNIDCVVVVKYEYTDKVNEDREDMSYITSTGSINFIDHPEVLK